MYCRIEDRDEALTLLTQAATKGHIGSKYLLSILLLCNPDICLKANGLKTIADLGCSSSVANTELNRCRLMLGAIIEDKWSVFRDFVIIKPEVCMLNGHKKFNVWCWRDKYLVRDCVHCQCDYEFELLYNMHYFRY